MRRRKLDRYDATSRRSRGVFRRALRSTRPTLKRLGIAARACKGCELYKAATQTVFGAGPPTATLMLVGEQPGEREDVEGAPFIGPAGQLLRQALTHAGIAIASVYITNAVKHFKWERRGKRRLHKHPEDRELAACRPWLEAEVAAIKPRIVIALGVSAAKSVFDLRALRLRDVRGAFRASAFGPDAFATIHPSALLRLRDSGERELAYADFVADLRTVADRLTALGAQSARAPRRRAPAPAASRRKRSAPKP